MTPVVSRSQKTLDDGGHFLGIKWNRPSLSASVATSPSLPASICEHRSRTISSELSRQQAATVYPNAWMKTPPIPRRPPCGARESCFGWSMSISAGSVSRWSIKRAASVVIDGGCIFLSSASRRLRAYLSRSPSIASDCSSRSANSYSSSCTSSASVR